jgi:peptidoglycan-N-acetylglucosamine deacetylase
MTTEEDTKPQFLQRFLSIIVLLSVMQACNNQPGLPGGDKSKGDSIILKKDSSKTIVATVVEDSTKKKIYLTFDDGPNPGTANVLDILDREKMPATFFLIGEHRYYGPEEQRDWDRLQANKQLVLCNHSYTRLAQPV